MKRMTNIIQIGPEVKGIKCQNIFLIVTCREEANCLNICSTEIITKSCLDSEKIALQPFYLESKNDHSCQGIMKVAYGTCESTQPVL